MNVFIYNVATPRIYISFATLPETVVFQIYCKFKIKFLGDILYLDY